MNNALIAGYSGLVGKELLKILLEDNRYDKVFAIGRRNLNINSSKLTEIIVNFDNLPQTFAEVNHVYCCLGTTIKKAGSKDEFRKVDFQFPLNLAQFGLEHGASKFLLVSSLGANSMSSIFYNRVKGELEQVVSGLEFKAIHIVRPSLLLGSRGELRIAELFGKLMMTMIGGLFMGKLRKFKAVKATQVAKAIHSFAFSTDIGVIIHPSDQLQQF